MTQTLKSTKSGAQFVLGRIEVGNGPEMIVPRPSEILLGPEGLEHNSHGEFLAHPCQFEPLFGSDEDSLGALDLCQ